MNEQGIDHTTLTLPSSVSTKADLARLVIEAEQLDAELTQAAIRTDSNQAQASVSKSESLSAFLEQNSVGFNEPRERTELISQLRKLKESAPSIHLTFAGNIDPASLSQLTTWFRESIHPQVVLTIGLQPTLVAGVYMRTPNHVHDFSLRSKLKQSRDILRKELEASNGR